MKSILTVLVLLAVISTTTNAQLQKHAKIIGGGVSMNYTPETHSFIAAVSTFVQYFVADNFALGGGIGASYFSDRRSDSHAISIYPAARYYFSVESSLNPFVYAGVGYAYYHSGSLSGSGVGANGGVGLVYFINQHVGVQGVLDYYHGFIEDGFDTFTFGVGLQIYIP